MSTSKKNFKKRYLERKAAGLCTVCGVNPKKPTSVLCVDCRAKSTENQRKVRDNRLKDPDYLAAAYARARASNNPVREISKLAIRQYRETLDKLAKH